MRRAAITFFLVATPVAFAAEPPRRVEFTRMIAHLAGYHHPGYLEFIEEVKPEVVQVGWYGAHFYSLAPTPHGKGYPAQFPVQGLRECGDWFTNLNRELHQRNVKIVGHFNVEFLVGDPDSPEGPRGFFKFYRDLWDEKELGPRPVKDVMELLERGKDGKPIVHNQYGIGGMKEYWACLNNPKWRLVLKAWVRAAVRRGVDGLIANYFYRHDCHCPHCVTGFKEYLRARFSAEQLRERFGIADLSTHVFDEIVAWHDPKMSTPLRREMLRFSQIGTKAAFDDVFVQFGRSLKPGFIVGQWNHLGDFNQISGDERCLLPAELWGRDEDYLWYSTGSAAFYTDLERGFLGEGTLQARYIRGAFDDKPFTLGKYESTRTRVTIAELAANGGAPMGLYARYTDPMARAEMVRYYKFLRANDALFHANKPAGEVVLLYPRARVHEGAVAAVEKFKMKGKELLDAHVLFDVLPDDLATPAKLAPYRHVVRVSDDKPLSKADLSQFTAPPTVRVSASRPAQGDELTLHFVNYNREEPKEKRSAGGGIKDEKPVPVANIVASLVPPRGYRVIGAEVLQAEPGLSRTVAPELRKGRVEIGLPPVLVYAVVRVKLEAVK